MFPFRRDLNFFLLLKPEFTNCSVIIFKMRVKNEKEYKDENAVLSYVSVMDLRIGLWLCKILELKALP